MRWIGKTLWMSGMLVVSASVPGRTLVAQQHGMGAQHDQMQQMQTMMQQMNQMMDGLRQMNREMAGRMAQVPEPMRGSHDAMRQMGQTMETMGAQMKGMTERMQQMMGDQHLMQDKDMQGAMGLFHQHMKEMMKPMDDMMTSLRQMEARLLTHK